MQDRSFATLAEHEVDGAGHPGNQGDDGRLVALPDDPQRPMPSVKAEILGVGAAGFADPEPIEAQEHRQGSMVAVIALGREEEGAQFTPVQSSAFARVNLGAPYVLSRVSGDPPVDVGKSIEPADGGQSAVDRRGRQPSLLHIRSPQLDVGPGGLEHGQTHIGTPLEKDSHVVAVGLESASAVAGEVGSRCYLSLIEGILLVSTHEDRGCHVRFLHVLPPFLGDQRTSAKLCVHVGCNVRVAAVG
jgi:hypothetical protein